MIYREENRDKYSLGKDYYKIEYLSEEFAIAIGLDASTFLRVNSVILDQEKGIIYVIYPTTNYIYLSYMERVLVQLRNFLTSTDNKDILTTNKIATDPVDILNIEWKDIANLYKNIFQNTNTEVLVCYNDKGKNNG